MIEVGILLIRSFIVKKFVVVVEKVYIYVENVSRMKYTQSLIVPSSKYPCEDSIRKP